MKEEMKELKPQQLIKDFNIFIKQYYIIFWIAGKIQKGCKSCKDKSRKVNYFIKCAVCDN